MQLSSLLSGNGEMEGGASPATDQSCIHMTKSLMASHRNPVCYLPIPSLTRKRLLSHTSHTWGGGQGLQWEGEAQMIDWPFAINCF